MISDYEKKILRHTTCDETCFRNHFLADIDHSDYPILENLVRKGMMEKHAAPSWVGGGIVYYATKEGIKAAWNEKMEG